MGNLCDAGNVRSGQTTDDPENIFDIRRESQEIPPIPIHLQEKIAKLTSTKYPNNHISHSKIWEVQKNSSKFYYVNEPAHEGSEPLGLCTIYFFHTDNQFKAYFKGFINNWGLRENKGSVFVFSNGDYFIGDPEKSDYGTFISEADSYKYQGDWVCGKAHGLGAQISKKGTYKGYFREGKKHGEGKFINSESLSYEGEFYNNCMQGMGKFTNNPQNYEYVGSFKSGMKSGYGVEKTSEYEYEGNFVNNYKQGKGKIRYLNLNIWYEGEFQKNMPHGMGTMKCAQRTVEGVWVEGDLKAIFPNKTLS